MAEKRKKKRAKKYFAVNIVAVDTKGKVLRFDKRKANPKFHDETGLDFSTEGANIMCSRPLPPEAKVQMKLLIPDESGLNMVKANGTIKWFKQVKGTYKKYFIMGVNFRDMEEADKDVLLNLWKKYKED